MTAATEGEEGAAAPLDALQQRFAEALQGGDDSLVAGLGIQAEGGADAVRRFAVYRNNVYHSLTEALADAHPVVLRLVGEKFFRALARAWLDAGGLPRHAPLHDYGAGFPAFVEAFPPAAQLPWLGDVAQVEQLWLRAWHGADAQAPCTHALHAEAPEGAALAHERLLLHPSLTTADLRWPAVAIWQAHQQPDAEARLEAIRMAQQENVAVAVRAPPAQVRLFSLSPEAGGFVSRLQAGEPVLDAAQSLGEDEMRQTLAALAEAGAILGLGEAPTP